MPVKLFNRLEQKSDKKIAYLLLFIAFFFRGTYACYYYFFQNPPDTNLYFELALEIIKQQKIFYNTNNSYFDVVGPVIPWMNALTMTIFGKNYLGLYLISAFGSALITYLTYKTARLFLDKKTALFAGIGSLFYMFYFYFTPSPGKDIWMACFLIYFIYMLLKLFNKDEFSWRGYILFSIAFVMSIHMDERYVIFLPLFFIYILYYETNAFRKFNIKKSLLFGGIIIVLMLPWAIRNYLKYDKIVLLTTRTERYTDRLFGYDPPHEYFSDEFTEVTGRYYIKECQMDSVITGLKTHTDAGHRIPDAQIKAMQQGELPGPLLGVRAFYSRLRTMFQPFQIKGHFERTGYYYYKKSIRHNITSFIFYGIILFFSFPGFYYIYKTNRNAFYLFLLIISIYAVLHALSIPYTVWRYRLPLDAIFIMLGSLGLVNIFINKKIE